MLFESTPLELSFGLAFLIVANTAVSEWLVRRGVGWETTFLPFVAMAAINAGVTLTAFLLPLGDGSVHVGNTLFFLLPLTLIVTLYDRFRPYYLARAAAEAQALEAAARRLSLRATSLSDTEGAPRPADHHAPA